MRFKLFGRSKIPRRINLDDLAQAFWQDRSTDEVCSDDHGHISSETEPNWENPDVQDFWLQYVRPFQNTMALPVFRTIQTLLAELEKMEVCPSVSESDEETPKQYLALSQISLIEHSLSVCREAVDLLRVKENDFQMNVGKILVAALGHDMGKHPAAFIPNMPHSYKSAMWLQKRIGHLRDREQVIEAVRLHHADNRMRNGSPGNPILPILIQADLNARQKELANVNIEKQMENPGQTKHSHSSKENDPKLPETDQEKGNNWFSKGTFLKHLRSRITCMGFDSFCFNDNVYFSPAIVKSALNQMRHLHGLPDIESRPEIQRLLSSQMPEVRNEKYRLRFKNNCKPLKKWFYVFEASQLRSLGEMDNNNPRDREGRWLKNLDPI